MINNGVIDGGMTLLVVSFFMGGTARNMLQGAAIVVITGGAGVSLWLQVAGRCG